MELTNLIQFIPENLLILIVATYTLGIFLKKLDGVKDKYITISLMVFSITFSILLNIINTEYMVMYKSVVNAVLQGILCWGVAVGVNQTTKQLTKEE